MGWRILDLRGQSFWWIIGFGLQVLFCFPQNLHKINLAKYSIMDHGRAHWVLTTAGELLAIKESKFSSGILSWDYPWSNRWPLGKQQELSVPEVYKKWVHEIRMEKWWVNKRKIWMAGMGSGWGEKHIIFSKKKYKIICKKMGQNNWSPSKNERSGPRLSALQSSYCIPELLCLDVNMDMAWLLSAQEFYHGTFLKRLLQNIFSCLW